MPARGADGGVGAAVREGGGDGGGGPGLDASPAHPYDSSMAQGARRVLDEALRLSPEEQALVLRELLARLEGEPEPGAVAEWAREIERRAHEARAGVPAAGDWESVCDEIEAELRGR